MKLFKLYLPLLLFIGYGAVAQENIGVAAAVNKNTTDLTLAQERKLVEAGYKIIQNHTIETDNIGKAQMLLVDGTAFTIGPNSSVTLDRFIYNPETADGSLEVTSRGLMRLVGGKVTKKKPALIRTNAATIGIRGGIAIIQSQAQSTVAAFVYGDEMIVTPTQNSDGDITLTEGGFVVTVEDPTDEIDFPELLTVEALAQFQQNFEGDEKEEGESEDESEEESEEEEEAEDESTEEETEESNDEVAEDTADDDTTEDTPTESTDTDSETETDSTSETPVATEEEVAVEEDVDDPQPDVDEGALDSSGVSDVSSDVDPDDLSTADEFEADMDLDIDGSDDAQEDVQEETSEAKEDSVQDARSTFEVNFESTASSIDENTSNLVIGNLVLINPDDLNFTHELTGENSDQFTFDVESGVITFVGEADYESLNSFDVTLTLTSEQGDSRIIPISLTVLDINEAVILTSSLVNTSFLEDIAIGTTIATASAIDPEGESVVYSLSGEGSELFTLASDGSITLASALDYEATTSYTLTLTVSDGTNSTTENLNILIANVDEPVTLSASLTSSSFKENVPIDTVIASFVALDPDGATMTYALTGEGSELFGVDSDGNITLASALDYETTTSYSLTLTVSDGVYEASSDLAFNVTDVAELNLLITQSGSVFAENTAIGTAFLTATANDPSAGRSMSYSLSGAGSGNFDVSSNGTVTLNNSLDYEASNAYTLTLTITDGVDSESKSFSFQVSDINEPLTFSASLAASSFAENLATGATIATSNASDPENATIIYTLSGTGSDKFSVSTNGTVTLNSTLDYETTNVYALTLSASDGTFSSSENLSVAISNVDEPLTLSTNQSNSTFAENTGLGTTIATFSGVDPDGGTVTYTLSGTGNDKFSISSNGTLVLLSSLDYEATTSYTLTVTASDGAFEETSTISFAISDVDEAINLNTSLVAGSLAENSATGVTVATATATDPEGLAVSYSLSGTGSNKFSVSSDGTVTLSSGLDYETQNTYTITLTVSNGTESVSNNITVTISDVNEAPTVSSSLAASSFNENISTGTTIASASSSDPEGGTITYSLSGSGSDKFSVSSDGTVTLTSGLDYESTTSYSLTLTASDGTYNATDNFTVTVKDVNEAPTLSSSLAANSYAENIATGTTIATSSTSDPEGDSISYSLSGTGSDKFNVSSDGTVTLSSSLDYESTTSHNLTLTASDGTNSTNSSFTVSVTNVDLSLSSSLASTSQDENISTGTAIATSSTSNAEGTVTYSLTDADNKFAINSSTGAVTLANAIDYETKTSHQFTITATDGVTTTSQTFTLSVSDAGDNINTLAVTLANSGAAIVETSSSGTAVASSSIDNPTSESISYSLSGTGSSDFAVDSSGNITTNTTLDFETAKSYSLTLTASGGGTTVTDSFTVNVGNVEELESAVLRYSAAWGWVPSGPTISGWSITAPDRGPSSGTGSGLPAYTLEQVGTTNTTDITSVVVLNPLNGNYVPVEIDSGTALNWRYYFPVDRISGIWLTFPGGQSAKYYSPLGTAVTTNVSDAETISGGRLENSEYWFMTTSKSAANITYESATGTNSTYNLYEDQVTIAGEVYKDANFISFTDGNKRVIAMVVLPINNDISADYFYPNFIPSRFWHEDNDGYGNVGLNYCTGVGLSPSTCSSRGAHHTFSNYALRSDQIIDTSRFYDSTNELPEGMSMWWQVLNPNGVGVGLWAQISLKDTYDPTCTGNACTGASGNFRDDQESLLNVIFSNVDYRKNDTTRYSADDIGLGMNGYHYWSYQGATDADDYSKTLTYGTSPIECATSNDTGCFWGETSNQPSAAMITSSDPYKSGDMTLARQWQGSNYDQGTFNISAVVQDVKTSSSSYADYVSLSDFRSSDFYLSSASSYSGFFSGILEFAPSGGSATIAQLTSMRSSSTLASFTFDTTNDTVQVVVPMTISAPPLNNFTGPDTWRDYVTGSMTLKFGDANNDEAKSAYISSEVFGAEIQNDGAQIDASSGGSNNLAGVMVSYNTLEKGDADLFNTDVNDSMPNTDYSTWGFWAMAAIDIGPGQNASVSGSDVRAAVHLGTWVGGEVVAQNEIPSSGSASMSGAAVMKVAYRYNQTDTNYDVHKYTTTADVAATFNWGASGYSGTLDFTNFDDKNPIVDNAGFASFSVAITGTDHTYTGDSTDTLDNSWLGGASVAGALYGGSSPQESGGRVNVSLYKTGDRGTAGENDFYMAEGIYLVDCTSGTCQ